MYNVDELLARMKNGESAESIADEMADLLNAASKSYEAEVAAAKAKETAREAAKKNDLRDVLDYIVEFLVGYYPDMCKDATGSLSDDDKEELYETMVEIILKSLDETATQVSSPKSRKAFGLDTLSLALMASFMDADKPAPKISKATPAAKTDDEILKDFLSKICH